VNTGLQQEFVDGKIRHLTSPKDEVPRTGPGNVINLPDALRKSRQCKSENAEEARRQRKILYSGWYQAHKSISEAKVDLARQQYLRWSVEFQ